MAAERQEWQQERDRWRAIAAAESGTLLFESSGEAAGGEASRSYLFREPIRVLEADDGASLGTLFAELNAALAEGHFVAGLLRYEAGYVFERVRNRPPRKEPLAWFGVYREPAVSWPMPAEPTLEIEDEVLGLPLCLEMEISFETYREKVLAAKRYIAAGDTYQVNLTTAVGSSYGGEVLPLFRAMAARQPASFSALFHLPGERYVLSFSPEMFFRVDPGGRLTVRPMKGTAALGRTAGQEDAQRQWLAADEKNRAEHVMIVDLLRSDAGRICQAGSVQVDRLFAIERYRTLLQMTSTVSGQLRPGTPLPEVLKALFPSGSMTGAPKPRTMEILAELEGGPRGEYSGALGFAAPDGTMSFNVAIRTATLEGGRLRMGVGGGIVADSEPVEEYRECWLKSRFAIQAAQSFCLVETLLWQDGFPWLAMHLQRMERSAERLDFRFDRERIEAEMTALGETLQEPSRVRAVLARDGALEIGATRAAPWPDGVRLDFARERVWSEDSFLRHKTTYRPVYDEGLRAAHRKGCDEAIFQNERGELTEGSISSLLVRLEGEWRTPAIHCGVLPGVARTLLLQTGRVAEAVLSPEDLERAEAMCVCNGVRGVGAVRSLALPDGRVRELPLPEELPRW